MDYVTCEHVNTGTRLIITVGSVDLSRPIWLVRVYSRGALDRMTKILGTRNELKGHESSVTTSALFIVRLNIHRIEKCVRLKIF
jgi:hypothetical protein